MKDRNITTLKHILKYCIEVNETLNVYDNDKDEFLSNHIFRDSISMKILQIGELANHLTEEYIEGTINEMQWYQIIGMRNHFAHGYSKMDMNRIWETATKHVPVLKEFCIKEINKLESLKSTE